MPLEDPNFLLVQRCGEAWEAGLGYPCWRCWLLERVKLYHIVPPGLIRILICT